MRALYTLHAAEFLLGEQLSSRSEGKCELWIPAKDNGVDLLLTYPKRRKRPLRIQVKSSRSYGQEPFGWFTLKPAKIRASTADVWVFVIPFFDQAKDLVPRFVILPLAELKRRIPRACGDIWHMYLYAPTDKKCFQTRDWTNAHYARAEKGFIEKRRDFSKYLGAWNYLV